MLPVLDICGIQFSLTCPRPCLMVEIRQRAEEKKKKYASAGMKYTAEAMMRQGK